MLSFCPKMVYSILGQKTIFKIVSFFQKKYVYLYYMTFKQALFRYLKEKGIFGYLSNWGYSVNLRHLDSDNVDELMSFVDYAFYNCFHTTGELLCWYYTGPKRVYFFDDWVENIYKLKKGDIVYVKTKDGKYSIRYVIGHISIYDIAFIPDGSCSKISLNRIVNLNGKDIDFKNGWRLKKIKYG